MTYDYLRNIPAGYYDVIFRRKAGVQSKWHHLKFSFVATLLSGSVRRLVDAGCGPGTFSQVVSNDIEYLGLDISQAQVEYATHAYASTKHKFVVAANYWPAPSGFADAVTLVEVIEHLTIEQTNVVFSEAMRCLRPGGQIVVTTPNYRSMWPVLEAIVNRKAKVTYEDQHINRYTKRQAPRAYLFCWVRKCRGGLIFTYGPFRGSG